MRQIEYMPLTASKHPVKRHRVSRAKIICMLAERAVIDLLAAFGAAVLVFAIMAWMGVFV